MRRFVSTRGHGRACLRRLRRGRRSSATPAATEAADRSATEAPTEAATEAAGGAKLAIAADPGGAKKFTETELTATAGQVEIDFANESQLPHAVEIEGNGVEETTETVTGQDAPPLTVDLKPGDVHVLLPGRRSPRRRAWKAR